MFRKLVWLLVLYLMFATALSPIASCIVIWWVVRGTFRLWRRASFYLTYRKYMP